MRILQTDEDWLGPEKQTSLQFDNPKHIISMHDIIDDIVIINLFSICYFVPIGFVLLPKNASRQKTFKIAYLTLTVQHRA